MKRMQTWRWMPAALLLAMGGTAARADEFAIHSFDGTGQIVFGAVAGATNYQVMTAPTPTGAWSVAAVTVEPTAANAVTATVSMAAATAFYSVTAYTNVPPPTPAGMVLIPGGTNSGTDEYSTGGAYSLTVSSFYMDATEVTKAEWDEVYAWAISNGYGFDNAGSGKATDHPAHSVNWHDCVKWCNARSEKEGRPAVYTVGGAVYKMGQSDDVVQTSAAGYRLPTYVEWEYAARGGVASQRFPWGNEIQHARANYYSYSLHSFDTSPTRGYHPTYNDYTVPYTSPTGSFAANGYGLYDMAGNVFEWCFDWSSGYVGSRRVTHGGSWNSYAYYCCSAFQTRSDPDQVSSNIGFRAVLSPCQ